MKLRSPEGGVPPSSTGNDSSESPTEQRDATALTFSFGGTAGAPFQPLHRRPSRAHATSDLSAGVSGFGKRSIGAGQLGRRQRLRPERSESFGRSEARIENRALREAVTNYEVSRRFDHPNLARVDQLVVIGGKPPQTTLCADLEGTLEGNNAWSLALSGRLSPSLLTTCALHALTGLQELHSKGYLLRRIRPQNIVLAGSLEKPTFQLTDLGLSCPYVLAGDSAQVAAMQRELALPEGDPERLCFGQPLAHQYPNRTLFEAAVAAFARERFKTTPRGPQDDFYALGHVLMMLAIQSSSGKLPQENPEKALFSALLARHMMRCKQVVGADFWLACFQAVDRGDFVALAERLNLAGDSLRVAWQLARRDLVTDHLVKGSYTHLASLRSRCSTAPKASPEDERAYLAAFFRERGVVEPSVEPTEDLAGRLSLSLDANQAMQDLWARYVG